MTTSTRSSSAPTLRQVRPALWRVLREDGTLAGYIEGAEPLRVESAQIEAAQVESVPVESVPVESVPVESVQVESVRFEARRLVASTRQVVGLGHFASIDDAMLCFS
ncbi:MAG: hypothetical protein JWQ19_3653 [Subtercola sp.]|nr:hypothetical protein [Subtercola sp.]